MWTLTARSSWTTLDVLWLSFLSPNLVHTEQPDLLNLSWKDQLYVNSSRPNAIVPCLALEVFPKRVKLLPFRILSAFLLCFLPFLSSHERKPSLLLFIIRDTKPIRCSTLFIIAVRQDLSLTLPCLLCHGKSFLTPETPIISLM